MSNRNFITSAAKLSRLFGVTPKAIRDAKRTGRLSEGVSWANVPGGRYPLYDEAAARVEWDANVQAGVQQVNLAAGTHRKRMKVGNKSTLVEIKKAQALVDLERRTIQLEKEKGSLVERQAVYDSLFEFAQKVRGRLRAIPSRIVDDLLAAQDRVDTLRILSESIDEALNELADADTKDLKI